MPARTLVLGAFVGALVLVGPVSAGATSQTLSPSEATLLRAVNGVRTSHALPPLRVDRRLVRAARAHTADMLGHGYFAHGSLTGRMLASHVRGPVFGENIAWATDAQASSIVRLWLASPPHRAVLLRPGFRRIGLGARRGTFLGNSSATVVTADFAGR